VQQIVDIELSLPTTGEKAFVQTKSKAGKHDLTTYLERSKDSGAYGRMFFVWHTHWLSRGRTPDRTGIQHGSVCGWIRRVPASRFALRQFSWAGKDAAVRLLQTLGCGTLVPRAEESINFDSSSNVFIEGDNLEVFKLLFKLYFRRVKLIYIDPPYDTGPDFAYRDNYSDPLKA